MNKKNNGDTTLLITVSYNKDRYIICMYNKYKVEHKLQCIIGTPSTRSFIKYLQNNNTPNFPVNIVRIKATEDIFLLETGYIKGK